jgi:hypothetical protein
MDSQNEKQRESQPHEKHAGQADAKSQAISAARDMDARRQEKIQSHLAKTLDSPDTLQACMGPVACDLLEMLQGLKREINEALATGPRALERFENLRSTIELYARLANQAYKLANLEQPADETGRRGAIVAGQKSAAHPRRVAESATVLRGVGYPCRGPPGRRRRPHECPYRTRRRGRPRKGGVVTGWLCRRVVFAPGQLAVQWARL